MNSPSQAHKLVLNAKSVYLILIYTQMLYTLLPRSQSLEVNSPLWLKQHSSELQLILQRKLATIFICLKLSMFLDCSPSKTTVAWILELFCIN